MKLDLKQPELSVRNEYTLQLFDEDNNLLQEVKCHNAASSRKMIQYYMLLYPINYYYDYYLCLGTGTGIIDIENNGNDHNMFNRAFSQSCAGTFKKINTDATFTDNHFQSVITFPPTTSYVGDLTEIGVGSYSDGSLLLSHSLLVDAAGNPIIIKKTSTNILIVTIDFFISIKDFPDQPYNFKYFPAWASCLAGNFYSYEFNTYGDAKLEFGMGGTSQPYTLMRHIVLSPSYCNIDLLDSNNSNFLQYPIAATGDSSYGPKSIQINWNRQALPATAQFQSYRWDSDQNNFGFAHSIIIPGFGAIPLPNHEILPPYEYKNIIVGTGDGTTLTFLPYINEVVNAIGFVNGQQQNSSFINFDPIKSPLWNKLVKIQYGDIIISIPSYECVTKKTSYWYSTADINYCQFSQALLSDFPSKLAIPWIDGRHEYTYVFYDETGITLDHLRIGGVWGGTPYSGFKYIIDVPIQVFISDDNATWQLITTINKSYTTFYFTRTTAKYWKIIFQTNDQTSYTTTVYGAASTEMQYQKQSGSSGACGIDPKFFVAGDSQEFDFGKCGITFETPPPEGAIITMDAILDLPYKDTDIVMTMSVEVEQPDPNEVTV